MKGNQFVVVFIIAISSVVLTACNTIHDALDFGLNPSDGYGSDVEQMLLFDRESSDIDAFQRDSLAYIVDAWRDDSLGVINLTGYSSDHSANLALTEQRIAAVVDYLITQGVNRSAIAVWQEVSDDIDQPDTERLLLSFDSTVVSEDSEGMIVVDSDEVDITAADIYAKPILAASKKTARKNTKPSLRKKHPNKPRSSTKRQSLKSSRKAKSAYPQNKPLAVDGSPIKTLDQLLAH